MHREIKRQGVHVVFGSSIVLAALVLSQQALVILLTALLVVQAITLLIRDPITQRILELLERDHNKARFPGKGALAITMGALLTALIFPLAIIPAMLVVAFADAASTIIGVRFGRSHAPWSERKSWAGIVAFALVSASIMFFYTPWWPLAALALTAVEAADYQDIAFLDDNLLLPLTVGALLVIV